MIHKLNSYLTEGLLYGFCPRDIFAAETVSCHFQNFLEEF